MKDAFFRFLAWAKHNERHISGVVFVVGFVGDVTTYLLVPVSIANILFMVYIGLCALATIVAHIFESSFPVQPQSGWLRRTADVLMPLVAQFFLGSLLSGFLIFYTKSSVIFVSWPFLILLVVIFLGNEVFRDYRAHLAFQTILLFFSLYAYLIFALPLAVHALGPIIFIESTALTIVVFAVFLLVLGFAGWSRLRSALPIIIGGSGAIMLCIIGAYFTGLIPPIPLTLQEGGVYHSITRTPDGYTVAGEPDAPWWEFWQGTVVHQVAGTPLYAYSAVFAPVAFSTGVQQEWQWYDTVQKKWITKTRVIFPISGGRRGGYRGYSEIMSPAPGKWQVLVETPNDQVIGRIDFEVQSVHDAPALISETK